MTAAAITGPSQEPPSAGVNTDAPGSRADSQSIESLFAEIAGRCALTVRAGSFAATPDLPCGAEWQALYSAWPDPTYRYAFAIWWGEQTSCPAVNQMATWVMLNPATGDTDGKPRPILTGCRHRSERWGHDGLIIVNVFAYRARNPKELVALSEQQAVGPHNDLVLGKITRRCGRTIAAWGDAGAGWRRSETVRKVLDEPMCLPKNGRDLSLKGQPFYPKGIRLEVMPVELP